MPGRAVQYCHLKLRQEYTRYYTREYTREHSRYCAAKAYINLLNRKQKDRTAELLNIKTETTDTYVHDVIFHSREEVKNM